MVSDNPPGITGGEDFLYVFKPGRHGPNAPPLHPGLNGVPQQLAQHSATQTVPMLTAGKRLPET